MSRYRYFFRFRMSLTFKFLMAMFFLVLMSGGAFGYFVIAREMALLRNHLETLGASLSGNLAFLIQHETGLSDQALLKRVAERLVKDEDIVSCALMDETGTRLVYALKPGISIHPNLTYHIEQPLHTREGEFIGSLQIGLSLQKFQDRMFRLKWDIFLVTLGMIGIGILFTIIFTRIFLRPIEKLVAATERVGSGELAQAVDIRSRDEIGDLARAFNHMTLQLKESRTDLESKVEERTGQLEENIEELNQARMSTLKMLEDLQAAKRELEMVNRELKEMDEIKMKFIGIASHELKTPLTAIKANIDFILSEKEGKISEHLKSYLLTIQRNTNRIQMRMDHMLDLTRIKSGQFLLYPEPIHLTEVVGGYINEVKPVDKNLSIQVDIPEDLIVYADKNGIHDIFINLLSNAFKFTPDGGQIKIVAGPKGDHVLHEIRDTGLGISKEETEKVFQEFYQVEGGKFGGTGLGLAITKRLVEEQGGKIWVESRLGVGSTFYFTLPATSENHYGRTFHS